MQNITEAPQLKENEIPPFALSLFSLLSLQRFEEKATWLELDGVAAVVWGLCRAVRGPVHGFFITLIMHVSADIQWFQTLLSLNYCSHIWLELGFTHVLSQIWFSLPSLASLWSRTSPPGGSRCIWGAVDDSRPVEWTLYRPFSIPFLFSPRRHRKAAIITVMICSPPGGGAAVRFTQTHVWGSLPRRTHAVTTTTRAARDFQADRDQDRHGRLTPRLSEALLQNQERQLRGEMSQHSLSLSPASQTSRDPVLPASSSETCHILAKKNQLSLLRAVIWPCFSSFVVFFWSFWSRDTAQIMDHQTELESEQGQVQLPWWRNERWEGARIHGFVLTSAMCSAASKVLWDSTVASPTGFTPK